MNNLKGGQVKHFLCFQFVESHLSCQKAERTTVQRSCQDRLQCLHFCHTYLTILLKMPILFDKTNNLWSTKMKNSLEVAVTPEIFQRNLITCHFLVLGQSLLHCYGYSQ